MSTAATKTNLRTAVITLALVGVLFAIFAGWYHRTHPPYKWPVIPPPAKMPSPNAFNYYMAAYHLEREGDICDRGLSTMAGHPDFSAADRERAATENLAVVAKVGEGFTYSYGYPQFSAPADPWGSYPRLRAVARCLLFEGRMKAAHGNWDDAASCEIDAMRMGADMMHGPGMVAAEAGLSCQQIGGYKLWDAADHVDAAAARIDADRLCDANDRMPAVADVLQQSKWSSQADMMESFKNPKWREPLMNPFFNATAVTFNGYSPTQQKQRREKLDAISDQQVMTDETTLYNALIHNAKLPYPASLTVRPPSFPADLVLNDGIRYVANYRAFQECRVALNELFATGFALRAYQLDHGSYPLTLSALAPEYLPTVPTDPFTADLPLTYRNIGASYLLYSVGPDGNDDGGKPIIDRGATPARRYRLNDLAGIQPGDIVAGVNY